MQIKIDSEVKQILNIIKKNKYDAYVVGGYVRDKILDKESYDVDITTDATPEVLKEIFKNHNIADNYLNLGNIKFTVDKYDFEITTYRKEYEYINYRKPNKIEYVKTLQEDLKRRDFTINTICSDGENIIDLYNGVNDLDNKIIISIGDPFIKMQEDALRILRAIRFASKLGFEIDINLLKAMNEKYTNLSYVSFETKYKELKGILEGEYFIETLKKYENILKCVFNISELNINLFEKNMNYEVKEALFFYYSNNKINNKYLLNKELIFENNKVDLKRKLNKYGIENIYNILYFRSNIIKINIQEYELLQEILDNKECYNLKMLKIKGEDLIALNIKNDRIGRHLESLLTSVIENKCINNKRDLIEYLKNNIEK